MSTECSSSNQSPPVKKPKISGENVIPAVKSETFPVIPSTSDASGLDLLHIFNTMVANTNPLSVNRNGNRGLSKKNGLKENSRLRPPQATLQMSIEKDILKNQSSVKVEGDKKTDQEEKKEDDDLTLGQIPKLYSYGLLSSNQAVDSIYHMNRAQLIQFTCHAVDAFSNIVEQKIERQKYLDKRRLDLAHILIRLGLVNHQA